MTSLTESVQAQVVSHRTSMDLWNVLQSTFSSTSKSRQTELQRQVCYASKGSSTCADYLKHIRRLADELAFVGAPLSDGEPVNATIMGLNTDYNPIIAAINTASRTQQFSFSDLYGLLLSHETLLRNQQWVYLSGST